MDLCQSMSFTPLEKMTPESLTSIQMLRFGITVTIFSQDKEKQHFIPTTHQVVLKEYNELGFHSFTTGSCERSHQSETFKRKASASEGQRDGEAFYHCRNTTVGRAGAWNQRLYSGQFSFLIRPAELEEILSIVIQTRMV